MKTTRKITSELRALSDHHQDMELLKTWVGRNYKSTPVEFHQSWSGNTLILTLQDLKGYVTPMVEPTQRRSNRLMILPHLYLSIEAQITGDYQRDPLEDVVNKQIQEHLFQIISRGQVLRDLQNTKTDLQALGSKGLDLVLYVALGQIPRNLRGLFPFVWELLHRYTSSMRCFQVPMGQGSYQFQPGVHLYLPPIRVNAWALRYNPTGGKWYCWHNPSRKVLALSDYGLVSLQWNPQTRKVNYLRLIPLRDNHVPLLWDDVVRVMNSELPQVR